MSFISDRGENLTKNIINLSEHKKKKGGHFSHGHFNKASCPGIESVPTARPRTRLWLIHLLALFPPKLPSALSLSKSAGKSCWESMRGRLCVRGRCRLCRERCRPCGEMLNGLIFGERLQHQDHRWVIPAQRPALLPAVASQESSEPSYLMHKEHRADLFIGDALRLLSFLIVG